MIRHLLKWCLAVLITASSTTVYAEDNPRVKMVTTDGDIVIELFAKEAPISTENFLFYVREQRYDHTIFHRIIEGYVIQGGGYRDGLRKIEVEEPIKSETENGLKNTRGTIAMARHSNINSATSQFFFNLKDNSGLDSNESRTGYTVFGKVVEGLETLDYMAIVETIDSGNWKDVPKYPITLIKAEEIKK